MVILKNKFDIKAIKFDGTNQNEIEDFIRLFTDTIISFDTSDPDKLSIGLWSKSFTVYKNQYIVCFKDKGKDTSDSSLSVVEEEYIQDNYNIL